MSQRLAAIGFLLLAGCLTSAQDGHYDACRSQRRQEGMSLEDQAQVQHDACWYDPPFDLTSLYPDPDAYERGFLRGYEDCTRQPYIDAWLALDAASPCADVVTDEPLPDADTAEVTR